MVPTWMSNLELPVLLDPRGGFESSVMLLLESSFSLTLLMKVDLVCAQLFRFKPLAFLFFNWGFLVNFFFNV